MKCAPLFKMISLVLMCSFLFGCSTMDDPVTPTSLPVQHSSEEIDFSPMVINTREELSELFAYDFSNAELVDLSVKHAIAAYDEGCYFSYVGVIFKDNLADCQLYECIKHGEYTPEDVDMYFTETVKGCTEYFPNLFYEELANENIYDTIIHHNSWGGTFIAPDDEFGSDRIGTSIDWITSPIYTYGDSDEYSIMVLQTQPMPFCIAIGDIKNDVYTDTDEDAVHSPTVINTREDLKDLFGYDFSDARLYDIRVTQDVNTDGGYVSSSVGVIFKDDTNVCKKFACTKHFAASEFGDDYIQSEFEGVVKACSEIYPELFEYDDITKDITHFHGSALGFSWPGDKPDSVTTTSVYAEWFTAKMNYRYTDDTDEYVVMVLHHPPAVITVGDIKSQLLTQ